MEIIEFLYFLFVVNVCFYYMYGMIYLVITMLSNNRNEKKRTIHLFLCSIITIFIIYGEFCV